ncbi:MAG: rhodanese-related sulfurtransferase [Planctomycetota bacterium]|jgi:rhodanese-related sulfurtransferase
MSYETTNPAGAKAMLEGDDAVVFIDVRTVREHVAGHVNGAYNVPIFEADAMGRMTPNNAFLSIVQRHFDPSRQLILGCEIGKRSAMACQVLADAGYTALTNMHGGFRGWPEMDGSISEPGWEACGFPTSVETQDKRSYEDLQDE